MSRRTFAVFARVGLLLVACTPGEEKNTPAPPPSSLGSPTPPTPARRSDAAEPHVGGSAPLRFLAIGGGATPDSTEVSLEQDIDLIRRALPPPGRVLFAGGTRSQSVRELAAELPGDPVMLALGNLLSPRAGRDSRYRPPRFNAERATLENVEASLSSALAVGEEPLVIHITTHGEQGAEGPRSNSVALWGGRVLTVARLAELHEQHQRALRLVVTSCFSGGFAELAFARADDDAGPSRVPRCGLFAGTSDRKTSGCDPNPDRRAQESYSVHFTHALSGTRKDGTALPPGGVDYDGDGRIGLLDAHTWARIQAISFDVPTTTSERWLRRVEAGSGPLDERLVPEEAAVIRQLGEALGLASEGAVAKRWSDLDQRLTSLGEALTAAEDELAEREAEEAMSLLERWPVLDDPFHPDFAVTFERNRGAIMQALTDTKEAKARALVLGRVQALDDELGRVGLEEARVLRLSRAYETLHKVAALMKKGGPAARYYASLLACERGAP